MMDEPSTDLSGLNETEEISCYRDFRKQHFGCVLWPYTDNPLLKLGLVGLLAFLCDLANEWTIHNSGRYYVRILPFPAGSFHFPFSIKTQDEVR
jgi:hypothetical protein